ncbi:nitrogenase molybdenum-iron protein subunit beta [Chrysiogenes arsenatis]|uniref:nitrogenase molybdenum-iron protein subunit beta n=1 Tax=Chrysiogenes arsenatis TaxID=309797 RepID=UPI0003FAA914|nr:nitrogenase molybdenum-iron protein subunit beta [Chrysiogenes arsenatis]
MSCQIKDHLSMFKDEVYTEMLSAKRSMYENAHPDDKVAEILAYTKTEEYKEKNFAREALVINPLKACQPLGSMLAALGFEKTMSYVHGSQGCAAYFRSHLARHFKEPVPAVSDSMTEDAAVFGGHNNMYAGLENTIALYKPEMIAVCTTCMAEVIGDDLASFVKNAKEQGIVPADMPVPAAHTPSFVGSHITGYDAMMLAILGEVGVKSDAPKKDRINVIMGFDTYIGNYREIKRIFAEFGVECLLLSDPTEMLDSPTTGEYQMYQGGTPLDLLRDAPNSKATIFLQDYATTKTQDLVAKSWEQEVRVVNPIGLAGTDELIMAIAELSGKPVPASIKSERGRLVDAIADSYYWVFGKSFAINGDPDLAYGMTRFIMEMGGEPKHVLVTNATKKWGKATKKLLESTPLGAEGEVYPGKDMWHYRSLLFSKPVDMMIGSTYSKLLWRETGIPLVRIGFPIFDRHHLHRTSIIGYTGGINVLTTIVNTLLEEIDRQTKDSPNFDMVR